MNNAARNDTKCSDLQITPSQFTHSNINQYSKPHNIIHTTTVYSLSDHNSMIQNTDDSNCQVITRKCEEWRRRKNDMIVVTSVSVVREPRRCTRFVWRYCIVLKQRSRAVASRRWAIQTATQLATYTTGNKLAFISLRRVIATSLESTLLLTAFALSRRFHTYGQ